MLCGGAVAAAEIPGFVRNRVSVNGAEISYVVRQRSGPVLVLIPGSLVGADDWTEVVSSLDPDLTIMIVELRGHGKSWPPPHNATIESLADDVLRAADHARIGKFYVGGHSIGGMIAIEIGGRHRDEVKGIIAIEGWTHYSVARNAFDGQNDLTMSAVQRNRRDELRKPVMSTWTPAQVKEFTGIWRTWNGFDLLERTPLPVLELWGDRKRPHASREQMQIPERPNIELQWVAGASHFLLLERPGEVADAVNAFIHRVERLAPPIARPHHGGYPREFHSRAILGGLHHEYWLEKEAARGSKQVSWEHLGPSLRSSNGPIFYPFFIISSHVASRFESMSICPRIAVKVLSAARTPTFSGLPSLTRRENTWSESMLMSCSDFSVTGPGPCVICPILARRFEETVIAHVSFAVGPEIAGRHLRAGKLIWTPRG